MAEEEAGEKPQPATGGKSKLLVIIIAALLVIMAGGGAAFDCLVLPKLQAPAAATGAPGAAGEHGAAGSPPATSLGATLEMPPFIVNLAGEEGRYLKTTLVLQLSSEELSKEITQRTPQIKDAIITVLSSKTPDDILTIQGKYDLKVELMKRVNTLVASGVVREIYFVEFVVQ